MAATRTARVTLTVLLALTVVVSVVAVPTAAVGHDPTHGDDDPIGVETDNDSVGVNAGDDSVSVGTDGVETDTDDATDGLDSGSTDDATDGLSTVQDSEDEELPVNYSDIPFGMLPADLCQGAPEPPESPAEPPVENPAPVDPTNPPSAPVSQCDIFNPYDPPFDPTDLPDDPEADYRVYRQEVSPEGVTLVVGGSASPDSDYPNGRPIAGVVISEDGVEIVQYTRGDDGSRDFVVFSDVQHAPGTRTGSAEVSTVTIGKRAGANVVCDGEACSLTQSVAPIGEQEVPTNRSGGDGDDDPPVANPNPDADYTVYEASDDAVVVGGNAAYNQTSGPWGRSIAGVARGDGGEVMLVQYTRFNDGQNEGTLFSDVRYTPGTRQGQLVVDARIIGKRTGANVVCDGESCTVSQSVAPVGEQEVPTNRSGGDDGGPPAEVPCQYPVGPGDAPEPPVDPTNPPEPIPPVENPAPVNPTNPPSLPVGPCDAYDPNDPPSTNPDPDASYTVYETSTDAVVVGGSAAYNRSSGPWSRTIAGIAHGDDETTIVQYTRGTDGQTPFMTFVEANVDRDSLTKLGPNGYQIDGDTVVVVRTFEKRADATVVCDGSSCTIAQGIAPVGEQEVPTTSGDSSSSSTSASTASTSTTTAASGTRDASDATARVDPAGSLAAPDGSLASAPAFPGAFATGLPDAASAAEALMDLV